MNASEFSDFAKKLEALIKLINEEIANSNIDNEGLKDFQLEFKGGKCKKVKYKTPSGGYIWYTECDDDKNP